MIFPPLPTDLDPEFSEVDEVGREGGSQLQQIPMVSFTLKLSTFRNKQVVVLTSTLCMRDHPRLLEVCLDPRLVRPRDWAGGGKVLLTTVLKPGGAECTYPQKRQRPSDQMA
jgi:hypothetical protein